MDELTKKCATSALPIALWKSTACEVCSNVRVLEGLDATQHTRMMIVPSTMPMMSPTVVSYVICRCYPHPDVPVHLYRDDVMTSFHYDIIKTAALTVIGPA